MTLRDYERLLLSSNEAVINDPMGALAREIFYSQYTPKCSFEGFSSKENTGVNFFKAKVSTTTYLGIIEEINDYSAEFFIDEKFPDSTMIKDLLFPIIIDNIFGEYVLLKVANAKKPVILGRNAAKQFFNSSIKLIYKRANAKKLNTATIDFSEAGKINEVSQSLFNRLTRKNKTQYIDLNLSILGELEVRNKTRPIELDRLARIQVFYYRELKYYYDVHLRMLNKKNEEIYLSLNELFIDKGKYNDFPNTVKIFEYYIEFLAGRSSKPFMELILSLNVEDLYREIAFGDNNTVIDFIDSQVIAVSTVRGPEWRSEVGQILQGIIEIALRSASNTNYGRKLSVVSLQGGKVIKYLDLERSKASKPENYWLSASDALYKFDVLLNDEDYPIYFGDLYDELFDFFDNALEPGEVNEIWKKLYDEANSLRTGCIPNEAFVALEVGPFCGVTVYERSEEIAFKWVTGDSAFLFVTVNKLSAGIGIQTGSLYFGENLYHLREFGDDESTSKFQLNKALINENLVLLSVAILRDFWVYEDRGATYQETFRTNLPKSISQKIPKKVKVVYLPRKRYLGRVSAKSIQQELNLEARARHIVQQHFRKVNPSVKQRFLAQSMNVDLPEGQTLVSTHYRGDVNQQTVYKSKSALMALCSGFNKNPIRNYAEQTWFEFEQDVMRLQISLGFEILHQATSGVGDGGIDTLARKITKSGAEHKIIQSKKWKDPVYPDTVRELIGSLADFEKTQGHNAKGAIYTTSYFTQGAIDLAERHNIELVDGTEWSKALQSSQKT